MHTERIAAIRGEDDAETVRRVLYGCNDDEIRANVARLRESLGMPHGAAVWQTYLIGRQLGEGFDNFVAHIVGIRLHSTVDARHPDGREWWRRNRDQYVEVHGDSIESVGYIVDAHHHPSSPWWRVSVQLWLVRVFYRDSPLVLEFNCNPFTEDRIRIVGLEAAHTHDDLDRIYRAMRYVGGFSAGGRPLGSGMVLSHDELARRYWEWTDSHGRPPSQNDPEFTSQFYLGTRQFKRRISELRRTTGFTWPPARRE